MRKTRHLKKDDERNFKRILTYAIPLIILLILIIVFFVLYMNNRTGKYVSYTENSNVDYKVYLNENEFFEGEYLEKNQQYVSGLIKNIVADFEYDMNVEEKTDYNCTYRIDAVINVADSNTKNTLYKHTENLLPEKTIESNENKINITENVEIDFKHFNDMANKFITTYKLSSNNESTLNVNLVVKADKTEESITSLSIPLTKQTIAISTNTKLAEDQNKQILVSGNNETIKKISILGIVLSIAGVIYFAYKLIDYLKDTMTEEEKYQSEVKKILLNYGEYINKTDDYQFELGDFDIVRVQSFVELIKIKEDLSRPILMVENKEKTNTLFAITDNTRFIYLFALNLHQELLAEKNLETNEEEKVEVGVGSHED